MAYGQFLGYEPAGQPGAYNFQTANGQNALLFGPDAEDLRAKIDASNAIMPQPTANADPFANTALAANGADPVYGRGQAPSVADAGGGPAQVPETAVEGAAPPQVSGPQNVGFGLVRTPDGQLAQYRPGSGGVSQKALQKKATQGTEIPVSASESRTGGFDPNQDYLEGMQDVSIQERQQAETMAGREIMAAQAGEQMAREQAAAQAAQLAEQQRMNLQIEVKMNRDAQIKDAALKDYANQKIDPGRLYRGEGGTAKSIAAAIGTAMGAFGAAINKTPNFAMQLIENAIDRDVNAQAAEIAVKKQAADNAVNDYVKSGLSLDQSKGLVKQLQREHAAKQAEIVIASNRTPEVMANYEQWVTQHQKNRLQFEEDYRQKSLGTATKAVASQVQYPQGGTRGGYAPLSPKEQIGLAQDMKTLRKDDRPEAGTRETAKLDAVEGSVNSIEQSLAKYDEGAVPKTPETQNILIRAERGLQDAILGEGTAARRMPQQDRAMIQDVETAKQAIKSMHSVLSEQGALSGPESEAADRGMAPGATVGEVRRANALLAERLRSIRGVKDNK